MATTFVYKQGKGRGKNRVEHFHAECSGCRYKGPLRDTLEDAKADARKHGEETGHLLHGEKAHESSHFLARKIL